VPSTEFDLPVDTVISAISQNVTVAAGQDLRLTPRGTIEADPETGATNVAGVYAGGDCVGGPASVIAAIADGKRAAAGIDRALAGEDAVLTPDAPKVMADKEKVLARTGDRPRAWRPRLEEAPPERRTGSFEDLSVTLTQEQAVAEASRCLACGCGAGCEVCRDICKMFCFEMDAAGRMSMDPDKCVGCGMCAQRCPNANIEIVQTGTENLV